jgi:hypothetical protein
MDRDDDEEGMATGTPPPSGSMPPVQMSPADAMILAELRKISASGVIAHSTRTIASGVILAVLVGLFLGFILGTMGFFR